MNENFYKEFISFKSIFYFCSLPLRLDSYKGCSFGCLYCFSQKVNNRKAGFFTNIIPADPRKLKIRFENLVNNKRISSSVINSCLIRKIPIHFGSVSDPFQPHEEKYRVTQELLKILLEFNYPTVISTKSKLIIEKPYIDLIKKFPVVVQISFSTFENELSRKLEPNAPSPKERLNTLDFLAKNGFSTVARIQPFLYLNCKNLEEDIHTLYKSGVKHIIFEHLRIPTNSPLNIREQLWKNIGINYLNEYKKAGMKISRINYELNVEMKIQTVLLAKKICHHYGISFGSGDNDLHHFSDSFCCCGLKNCTGFENLYDGHLNSIAHDAILTGKIDISIIKNKWQPEGSIREFLNSDCRREKLITVKDYLESRIGNNKISNSLSNFYGIEFDPEKGYYIDKGTIEKNIF